MDSNTGGYGGAGHDDLCYFGRNVCGSWGVSRNVVPNWMMQWLDSKILILRVGKRKKETRGQKASEASWKEEGKKMG